MMLRSIATISTTVSTEEQARNLAMQLVESQLAGCVQIDGPIQSVYRWEEKVCDEPEYRLTCKTLPHLVDSILSFIRSIHPYQLPELLVATASCSADYADWLGRQVIDKSV